MSPLCCCKDCPTEFDCVEEGCQKKARAASSRFFMGIGRVHIPREEWSDYLFPLPLIMDAQGELAKDARHLVTDQPDAAHGTSKEEK